MVDRIALNPINQNTLPYGGSKNIPLKKRSSLKLRSTLQKSHSALPTSFSSNLRKATKFNSLNTSSALKSLDSFDENANEFDIYVAKLKFKLKLALYKLNQKDPKFRSNAKVNNYRIHNCEYVLKSCTSSSTKLITDKDNITKLSPKHRIAKKLNSTKLFKKSFQNSINVNLNEKSNDSISLNSVILNNSNNINLKLYSIKKDSLNHNNSTVSKIPLTLDDSKLALASTTSSIALNPPNLNSFTTNLSFNESASQNSLPSINKILKTPLKLTTSVIKSPVDMDQTIDDNSFDDSQKIGSSPLKHFATPNSFSVAKSLLQLGSGVYN